MAMSKAEYESVLGKTISDADYQKLSGSGLTPLHAKYDVALAPAAPSHMAAVPVPVAEPDPMLLIAPKPGSEPAVPVTAPASFDAAKKGGLAAFVKQPEAFKVLPSQQPVFAVEDLGNDPGGVSLADKMAHAKAAGVPVQPPLNKPVMGVGPSFSGGPAVPSVPFDPTNFGKTPHDIAAEQQAVKHLGNVGGYQEKLSAADAEQAEAFEGIAKNVADKYELEAQKQDLAAKKRQDFLTRYNAETTSQIEQYTDAKVDPNRYWHDKGTAGTVLAAIGIGLGGFAQGLAAGAGKTIENGGLQMVEQGIARDIENQKAEIARKGAGIEARKGLYAQYLQQFGDEQTAEAMAMETYLRRAKADIDAAAAKTTSKQVKINAEAMKEAIDDKIIQFKNNRASAGEHLWADAKARADAARAAGAAAAQKKLEERNAAIFKAQLGVAEKIAEKSGGIPLVLQTDKRLDNGVVLPAGSAVVVNKDGSIDMNGTEQVQKIASVNVPVVQPGGAFGYQPMQVSASGYGDVAKKAGGAAGAIGAIERMEKAAAQSGPWAGQKLADYNAAMSDYVSSYAVAKGMGQVSEAEEARVKATIAKAPTWLVGYWSEKDANLLSNQKKAIADEAASTAIAAGPPGAAPAPLTSAGAPK